MRRRRNEVTVELRKHKRDEHLFKRRNVPAGVDSEEATVSGLSGGSITRENLAEIVEQAKSTNREVQLRAVQQARFLYYFIISFKES